MACSVRAWHNQHMAIRDRVARLVAELPQAPQYPTQGATLFVDLERREVQRGYTPLVCDS